MNFLGIRIVDASRLAKTERSGFFPDTVMQSVNSHQSPLPCFSAALACTRRDLLEYDTVLESIYGESIFPNLERAEKRKELGIINLTPDRKQRICLV
jgi:hypothetical protein